MRFPTETDDHEFLGLSCRHRGIGIEGTDDSPVCPGIDLLFPTDPVNERIELLEPELEYNPKMPAPITVYVVDDEPIIASTLTAILNLFGFQATAFANTKAALEASRSGYPSLLITDVLMPGMNGIELAVQFKSGCPDCKVLLLSGQAVTSDLLDSAREAGHDFKVLAKPVPPEELLAVVRQMAGVPECEGTGHNPTPMGRVGDAVGIQ